MANPMKSKHFWTLFVQAITDNTQNLAYKQLSLSNIMDNVFDCGMMFVSGKNENIEDLRQVIQKAIPKWTIIVVNGDHTSNKKAKDDVREKIEWSKKENKDGVLILANTMGSRSFSIPEIQSTIIAYDKGSIDPTVQKVSRCLTPGKMLNGEVKEQGYIVTCSMDSNRDQTLTKLLIEEAAIQSDIAGQSLPKITKQLLNNVSILTTDELGNKVELTHDELIEEMSSSDNLKKVAYVLSKPETILNDPELLANFLSITGGKGNKKKLDNQLPETKNFISSGKRQSSKKEKTVYQEVMKKIEVLINTSSMISAISKGKTYRECLVNTDSDSFYKKFNIETKFVIQALDKKMLPEKLLDPVVVNTNNIIKSGDINKFHKLDNFGQHTELGIMENSNEKELWKQKIKRISSYMTKTYLSVATNMGYEVVALLELGVPKKNITIMDDSGLTKIWKSMGLKVVSKNLLEAK